MMEQQVVRGSLTQQEDIIVVHDLIVASVLIMETKYYTGQKIIKTDCNCVNNGGFEYGGGVSTWIDTAQINYSNQKLRNRLTEILKGWVTKFDIDGFRVDMAHLDLNDVFSHTWQKACLMRNFTDL